MTGSIPMIYYTVTIERFLCGILCSYISLRDLLQLPITTRPHHLVSQ